MAAPFAAIETATASSAVAAIANATLTVSGTSVSVIFNAGYDEAFGVAGRSLTATGLTSDLTAATQGASITIDGTSYTVTAVEPDGTGMTLLRLQEA